MRSRPLMDEAEAPVRVETGFFSPGDFTTEGGVRIPSVQVAFESYGTLNAEASNAVLLFHALTGSQHACGWNPAVPGTGALWQPENFEGWWERMIGPGKPLDTDRYFIICANLLGGCYGSSGPCSPHPDGAPWSGRFPLVRAGDQARINALLLSFLGVERALLVGPSVGGLVAMAFAALFPERTKGVVSIGSGWRPLIEHQLSVFEQILAIELDPLYRGGFYPAEDPPARGLALARIIGHKAFVCLQGLESRVRAEAGGRYGMLTWYEPTRSTQSYMLHQGTKFARRFDANSYIRISDMWISFDLLRTAGAASFSEAMAGCRRHAVPFLVFGIDTDACFPVAAQEELAAELTRAGVPVELRFVRSAKGHDSFLLEPGLYAADLAAFLARVPA